VNDFNRSLIEAAYTRLVHKKGSKPPSAAELIAAMFSMWVVYRDGLIEMWCDEIIETIAQETLIDQYEEMFDWAIENMPYIETPDEDDPESVAWWVAWGMACRRWMEAENNGTADVVKVTKEEAKVYLERALAIVPVSKNPDQPSLLSLLL
jgi:hypothetical protein